MVTYSSVSNDVLTPLEAAREVYYKFRIWDGHMVKRIHQYIVQNKSLSHFFSNIVHNNPLRDISLLTSVFFVCFALELGDSYVWICIINFLFAGILRAILEAKRPFEYDEFRLPLPKADRHRSSYPFPSMESYMAIFVYLYPVFYAYDHKDSNIRVLSMSKNILLVLAISIIFIIGVSRIYSCSRFIHQIIGSWLLGIYSLQYFWTWQEFLSRSKINLPENFHAYGYLFLGFLFIGYVSLHSETNDSYLLSLDTNEYKRVMGEILTQELPAEVTEEDILETENSIAEVAFSTTRSEEDRRNNSRLRKRRRGGQEPKGINTDLINRIRNKNRASDNIIIADEETLPGTEMSTERSGKSGITSARTWRQRRRKNTTQNDSNTTSFFGKYFTKRPFDDVNIPEQARNAEEIAENRLRNVYRSTSSRQMNEENIDEDSFPTNVNNENSNSVLLNSSINQYDEEGNVYTFERNYASDGKMASSRNGTVQLKPKRMKRSNLDSFYFLERSIYRRRLIQQQMEKEKTGNQQYQLQERRSMSAQNRIPTN